MNIIKKHSNKKSAGKISFPKINNGYMFALFFITSFIYFFRFGDYVLIFQEKQYLFIFSNEYLNDFLSKPGGLLELSGRFITQFYHSIIIGTILLSTILTLTGLILFKIINSLLKQKTASALLSLIPVFIIMVMQTHYFHLMEYNLGFLLVLLFFRLTILSQNKKYRYFILLLIPLFYLITGAFISLFLGIFIFYNLFFEKNTYRFTYSIIALVLTLLTFYIFKEILFLQPVEQLILFPLPLIKDSNHRILFFLLSGFLILLPVIIYFTNQIKINQNITQPIFLTSVIIVFAVSTFLLKKFYNPQTDYVIQLEELVFDEKWQEAINYQETNKSHNLIGQYFYNVALSESGQLCDRLFFGSQDFGTGSLILPWSNDYLSWGSYFYYSVGLINEAHRWAYEEMVVYGKRPQNIKLLAKTNIINGNYKRAKKYVDILKRTLFYKIRAKEYEKLLVDTSLIENTDMGEKRKIQPNEDFFIQVNNPQDNIPLLFNSSINNKKAFEYEMAWLMLSKDVETVAKRIKTMKDLGYKQIPRHIEEAALIYYNGTGEMPILGGLSIREGTLAKFNQYVEAYKSIRQNPNLGMEKMSQNFGNTFMYYFHFK